MDVWDSSLTLLLSYLIRFLMYLLDRTCPKESLSEPHWRSRRPSTGAGPLGWRLAPEDDGGNQIPGITHRLTGATRELYQQDRLLSFRKRV